MKLFVVALILLSATFAIAIRQPEGKHVTHSCISKTGNMKIWLYANTEDQNYYEMIIGFSGVKAVYKATRLPQSTKQRAPIQFLIPNFNTKMKLVIYEDNFSSGQTKPWRSYLISEVLGRSRITQLQCARWVY